MATDKLESDRERVSALMTEINDAWLAGRPEELSPTLHEEIVMVFPGFAGRAEGKRAMLAGFEDFRENARVRAFREIDRQVDVVDHVAVVSFGFEMVYEREGRTYRSTGRDLWVFGKRNDTWLALWRTMFDLAEEPVT
jgi:hypothetical protein